MCADVYSYSYSGNLFFLTENIGNPITFYLT